MGIPYVQPVTGVVCYYNPRLHELIDYVDSHKGDFSDEEIKELAAEYDETEEYIRIVVWAKQFRTDPARIQRRNKVSAAGRRVQARKRRQRHFEWTEQEDFYLERNWRNKSDRKLARGLTSLSCNRARKCKRTVGDVKKRRAELGLLHPAEMVEEKHKILVEEG